LGVIRKQSPSVVFTTEFNWEEIFSDNVYKGSAAGLLQLISLTGQGSLSIVSLVVVF